MKNINLYIIEKLHINKDTKQQFNYCPKDKDELKSLINQLVRERGNDADLTDINVSKITDMSYLFKNMNIKDIDISNWDVSNVTNMNNMFFHCNNFVGKSIEDWDVSKVETTIDMFQLCDYFDANLQNWNLKSLKNAQGMFGNTTRFTGKGLEKWKLPSIENINGMFYSAASFNNKGIENWNIDYNVSMESALFRSKLKEYPSWYNDLPF